MCLKNGVVVTMLGMAMMPIGSNALAKSYHPPAGADTASLTLSVRNKFAPETTIRNVGVFAYSPVSGCESQETVDLFRMKKSEAATGKTVPIAAGVPLGLTVFYMDARFAQTRRCAVSLDFKPVAGENYIADFNVGDEVDSCTVVLHQGSADVPAPDVTIHPQVCLVDNPGLLTSGQGLRVDLKIRVKTIRN